ncbi:DMT family transporter [Actinotalea sp. K2]|uniref:EamA family transporter n=1 Tax=Actinotalea sp. K2 TaxID=2939438 RepID=UPI002016F6E3|nr:EamA family transporter [Actinotalea sp. K2]MCL3863235.1 EamA family transporter [Actinotalea sp. K2]
MVHPPAADARVPAPLIFVASGLSLYVGAALAIGLFAVIPAAGVGWLRLVVAAVLLLAWRRPWRLRWSRRDLGVVLLFGTTLAAMNVTFYIAIDHLPLGTAVAIEFLGPVLVGAVTGVGWRERTGIVLAACGVVLLAGVTVSVGGPGAAIGLLAAGAAAACWAGYILLGRRVALTGDGVTRLSVAMCAGALVFAPLLVRSSAPVLASWWLVAAVVGVAVLSSVVPYALEQVVLRRVSAAGFAVLLAMLPAIAAVVGAVVLRQLPDPLEVLGLLLVSAAIALTSVRRAPVPARGAPEPR